MSRYEEILKSVKSSQKEIKILPVKREVVNLEFDFLKQLEVKL